MFVESLAGGGVIQGVQVPGQNPISPNPWWRKSLLEKRFGCSCVSTFQQNWLQPPVFLMG